MMRAILKLNILLETKFTVEGGYHFKMCISYLPQVRVLAVLCNYLKDEAYISRCKQKVAAKFDLIMQIAQLMIFKKLACVIKGNR